MADDSVEISEETPEEPEKPSVVSPIDRTEPYELDPMYPEPPPEPEPEPESEPEPPTVAPDPPLNLQSVVAQVSGQADISWDAPANTDSYSLFWTSDPTIPIEPADPLTYDGTLDTADTMTQITGLTDGTTYHLQILASNVVGDSLLSSAISFTPAPLPPPSVLPPALQNISISVGSATGTAILDFDEIAEDPTITPVTYHIYLQTDAAILIDPADPATYLNTYQVTPGTAIPETFTDLLTHYAIVHARNVVGDGPLSNVFFFRTVPAPNPPPPDDEISAKILASTAPDVSYLPLRLLDEEVGMLLEKQLRRISPIEEPKSLQSYLQRPRLIHWGRGESPMEVMSNLYRISDRTRIQLPLVVLYRESTMESWTEETGIPGFKEKHGAVLGFYPIRLQYRLMVIAFEQPVLDLLTMALYTTLRGNYRLAFPLEGHGWNLTVGGTILEGDSISFTHEVITNEEMRLYATRAEFALGTFSYHMAANEVPLMPVRYRFDQLRIAGNESTK